MDFTNLKIRVNQMVDQAMLNPNESQITRDEIDGLVWKIVTRFDNSNKILEVRIENRTGIP